MASSATQLQMSWIVSGTMLYHCVPWCTLNNDYPTPDRNLECGTKSHLDKILEHNQQDINLRTQSPNFWYYIIPWHNPLYSILSPAGQPALPRTRSYTHRKPDQWATLTISAVGQPLRLPVDVTRQPAHQPNRPSKHYTIILQREPNTSWVLLKWNSINIRKLNRLLFKSNIH